MWGGYGWKERTQSPQKVPRKEIVKPQEEGTKVGDNFMCVAAGGKSDLFCWGGCLK